MARKISKSLAKLDKAAADSRFIDKLTKDEKRQYSKIQESLRDDTRGELTQTEYHQLSVITMWLDMFDSWAKDREIITVETDLINQARMYRTILIGVMQKHRAGGKKETPFLDAARELILDLKGAEGDLKIEWKKKEPVIIIELEDLEDNDTSGEAPEITKDN